MRDRGLAGGGRGCYIRRITGKVLPGLTLVAALLLISLVGAGRAHASVLRDGVHFASLNGVRQWYRIAGSAHGGVPVVILHGGPGGSIYQFEHTTGPQLERFATVIYYDQRGSGRSSSPTNAADYSRDTLVADIEALRRQLGLSKITLLGYSFGGELALEYASRYPANVHRLVLEDPSNGDWKRITVYQAHSWMGLVSDETRKELKRLVDAPITNVSGVQDAIWNGRSAEEADHFLFHNQQAAALNRTLSRESGHRNTGLMANVVIGKPDPILLDRISVISAPALVIVGQFDHNVGVDMTREIAERLPHAKFLVFEGSGHFPDLEEPDHFIREVHLFITD